MRFIIMITLICFSAITIGCARNQESKTAPERPSVTDEQNAKPAEDPTDLSQESISKKDPQAPISANTEISNAQKYYLEFFSLLKTDKEAAIAALSEYVKLRFGAHPLMDKWIKLANRLVLDGKGTFLDMKHYTEWHLQMLIDVEPEKRTAAHTELLEMHQNAIQQIEMMGKMLEQQGENLETYEMPATFIGQ
ncbi:MAG: hypothetical protein OXN25_16770 [Candidatus Poribacteria bacterium]|nr:hypothetical protein [Candidatus Poribacteria bacterium]